MSTCNMGVGLSVGKSAACHMLEDTRCVVNDPHPAADLRRNDMTLKRIVGTATTRNRPLRAVALTAFLFATYPAVGAARLWLEDRAVRNDLEVAFHRTQCLPETGWARKRVVRVLAERRVLDAIRPADISVKVTPLDVYVRVEHRRQISVLPGFVRPWVTVHEFTEPFL
jgi:hypothetical protein